MCACASVQNKTHRSKPLQCFATWVLPKVLLDLLINFYKLVFKLFLHTHKKNKSWGFNMSVHQHFGLQIDVEMPTNQFHWHFQLFDWTLWSCYHHLSQTLSGNITLVQIRQKKDFETHWDILRGEIYLRKAPARHISNCVISHLMSCSQYIPSLPISF